MASLMETRRRILLNTPHLETLTDSLVSFDTDVPADLKEHKLYIEPIQDLHGYDSPWPAGGGKNKFSSTVYKDNYGINTNGAEYPSGGFCIYADNLIANTQYTISCIYNGESQSQSLRVQFFDISDNALSMSSVNLKVGSQTTMTFTTPENTSYVHISVNKEITNIQIEIGFTATSYAPYSNICPISGRTGVDVTRTGKNLLNMADVLDDAWISTARTNISSIEGANVFYADVPKNTTITFSSGAGNRCVIAGFENRPSTIIGATYDTLFKDVTGQVLNYTFNTGDCEFIALYLNRDQANKPTWIQLELGSTATPYEPYQAESYDIDFPSEAGTVYGGTLDVKTGVLTVDRAMVDLGTLDWVYNTSTKIPSFRTTAEVGDMYPPASTLIKALALCSNYPIDTWNHQLDVGTDQRLTIGWSGHTYVSITDTRYTDAATFKSAMSGVQLVYELATPITYQLTPHTLKTLRGVNNIWSDTSVNTQVRFWTHKKED